MQFLSRKIKVKKIKYKLYIIEKTKINEKSPKIMESIIIVAFTTLKNFN